MTGEEVNRHGRIGTRKKKESLEENAVLYGVEMDRIREPLKAKMPAANNPILLLMFSPSPMTPSEDGYEDRSYADDQHHDSGHHQGECIFAIARKMKLRKGNPPTFGEVSTRSGRTRNAEEERGKKRHGNDDQPDDPAQLSREVTKLQGFTILH